MLGEHGEVQVLDWGLSKVMAAAAGGGGPAADSAETGAVESVFAPSAGTRTFQIWVASNGATTVDSMGALLLPTIANWILVKDIGEAPA